MRGKSAKKNLVGKRRGKDLTGKNPMGKTGEESTGHCYNCKTFNDFVVLSGVEILMRTAESKVVYRSTSINTV